MKQTKLVIPPCLGHQLSTMTLYRRRHYFLQVKPIINIASKLRVPNTEGSASDRLESRRPAAEDRRCDTPTDSCHNTTTLRRPCRPDRTPCGRRPPSPGDRSPPDSRHHRLAYLLNLDATTLEHQRCHFLTTRAPLHRVITLLGKSFSMTFP